MMTKTDLPIDAAVGRATQDGVDAAEIEAALNRDPEELIDDPNAANDLILTTCDDHIARVWDIYAKIKHLLL